MPTSPIRPVPNIQTAAGTGIGVNAPASAKSAPWSLMFSKIKARRDTDRVISAT